MARFKTSGDISLQELINFFGGGEKLTDFYRGGGLVPTQRLVSGSYYQWYGDWEPEQYQILYPNYYARRLVIHGGSPYEYRWDGQLVTSSQGTNGIEYTIGTYQGPDDDHTWNYWSITRREKEYRQHPDYWEATNQNVPSSGDIKLTDFYGAYNS